MDNNKKDNSLNSIKQNYRNNYMNNQLIDFIYDLNPPHNLIKTWDHGIGKPDTITAGLQGIHIYKVKNDSNQLQFVGKFTRKA